MKSPKLLLWPGLVVYLVVAWVWPLIGLAAIVCMLAPVVVSFFRGRLWCGNYCPRGNFYNLFASLPQAKPPAWLVTRAARYFILTAIMTVFVVRVVLVWPSLAAIGKIFWQMVLVTTLLGAVLAARFSSRTWCMICPMGTLSSLAATGSAPKVEVTGRCVNCRKCTKACPMNIDVAAFASRGLPVGDPDCIKCSECVVTCPLKSLTLSADSVNKSSRSLSADN